MRLWKEPDEKQWYTVVVDGKTIATIEDSNKFQKDVKRIRNLSGIIVRPATEHEMIKVNAKTMLPDKIISKMEHMAILKDRKNSV